MDITWEYANSRRAILNRSNESTVFLEIAKKTPLTRQHSSGFLPPGSWITFLSSVLVPHYFAKAKKIHMELGHVNRQIQDMLTRFALGK